MFRQDDIRTIPIQKFSLSQVIITDSYRINAMEKEIAYLKSLCPDKLLAGFYETRGLSPKAEKYGGWESTEIRGHTLGHFLTAMAQGYANTHDDEILKTLNHMMDALKQCQADNGYLSAFEESFFDRVEQKVPVWVPWYTMHKIIAGLVQVYRYTENKTALAIVSRLGDWVYDRASRWDEEMQKRVLAVEYGGMNDCMYELYKISHNEKHLIAAHQFDEYSLLKPVADGTDILSGRHANTTIPKFLGALNRYCVLGESETSYLQASMNFWDIVVQHHSYVTGGNSEWEHFGEPDILESKRSNCNCETCNTYNMLRLSDGLFQLTGDSKYADFYENTAINAILSSQNPTTGMTTYFQPMATGYFKVYSTPFDKFWCCTGTGMENFTKLNEGIYYHTENSLYVNQYVSSIVAFDKKKVKLIQEASLLENEFVSFTIQTNESKSDFCLKLRLPDWVDDKPELSLNGESVSAVVKDGYLSLKREWKDGDQIELKLSMAVKSFCLPDNPHVVAFKYGPFVLSAGLGTEEMKTGQTGIMVTIPNKDIPMKDFITVLHGEVDEWLKNIRLNLIKSTGKVEFRLKNTDSDDLVFTPHFKQHEERYGIYWNFVKPDSQELKQHLLQTAQKQELEQATLDQIPIGNDQYELEHQIQGEHTQVDMLDDCRYRSIQKGGWFSYQMKVDSKQENILMVTYHSKLHGGVASIYINDHLLAKETIKPIEPFGFYTKAYPISQSLIQDLSTATVKFVAEGEKEFGGLFDCIRMVKTTV